MGGPAFTYWVSPTDEELFERYNPELQKKSLEGRYERQKAFDDYVTKLKEFSKSNKPSTRCPRILPLPPVRGDMFCWMESMAGFLRWRKGGSGHHESQEKDLTNVYVFV